jgi:ectoine hydroxylase-related dioxygenase (phytanoyl-CoA dioxygenase family)
LVFSDRFLVTDTQWHLDQPLPDAFDNPNYRTVKVFVGLWDLPPNGGATAVVPMTHRIPTGPSQTLARGSFRSSGRNTAEDALHQTLMPNYVEAALPAGCGIAFDSHVWHTSMPNTSGVDRRCAYFGYRSSGRFWPQLPVWGEAAGLSEETLKRLDGEGKLGVQRRRILGLPDEGCGE